MTVKERKEWDNLYLFVKKAVMGYDDNQSLSKDMVLRLKGMMQNKFMANNNVPATANYSSEVILNAFKYSIMKIRNAFSNMSFHDDMHKFNTAAKIAEKHINDVYSKMKEQKQIELRNENVDMPIALNSNPIYKKNDHPHKNNNRMNGLW